MRMVTCGECKKRYDFDKDDFCPRCGAFNPPAKQRVVDNYGNVIRVDGINERGHAGSFVHSEVHREKAVRRSKGLDRGGVKHVRVTQLIKKETFIMSDKAKSARDNVLATLISISVLCYLFGLLFGLW